MSFLDTAKSAINSVTSVFTSDDARNLGAAYLYEQQAGCAARIYKNDESNKTIDLYWEIQRATAARTIRDVGGSFSMTLLPTQPWDEIIEENDFIRIFMGDRISSAANNIGNAYNVSTGPLDVNRKTSRRPLLSIPIPGFEIRPGGPRSSNNQITVNSPLIMHERLVGKVDRCERVQTAGSKSSGTTVGYVVSGRSIGSIIQDMTLYYDGNIPGLNAVNIWIGSLISAEEQSPTAIVRQFLQMMLTAIPMPQWVLPKPFVEDIALATIQAKQVSQIVNFNADNLLRLAGSLTSFTNAETFRALQSLVQDSLKPENRNRAPSAALAFTGMRETLGSLTNRSFLDSASAGVFDYVKNLSNAAFNEFWIDLCPNGNPEGGLNTSGVLIPTVVMRQHPYDISDDMIENSADYIKKAANAGNFAPPELSGDISRSLTDLLNCSFAIYGSVQTSNMKDVLSQNPNAEQLLAADSPYMPTSLDYRVGRSANDILNLFLTMGSFPTGQGMSDQRVILSEVGGIFVDTESIKRNGLRVQYLQTPYAAAPDSKASATNAYDLMKKFGQLQANWYYLNPKFLNGQITSRFLPNARIGVPCRYIETTVRPDNPYPRVELFYTQDVIDDFQQGRGLTTSVTVTRGIRYNLLKPKTIAENVGFGKRLKEFSSIV